ncbi:unnamed protein product [Alopecurus aequalis]
MPPRGSTERRRGRVTEAAAAAEDALISLPPEVLDGILTRVGIRDAVRTSALSRAWRHRWEALPSLDLCFPRRECAREGLEVVDGILLRYPGRVRLFEADLDGLYAGRIHDWLRVLSRRGVEILDLSFSDVFPALPSSVFSCRRLTSLTLRGCAIPLLPAGFMAFPELRRLILVDVQLQQNGEYQLEEIIETSPLLEHLHLTDVRFGTCVREWVIRAPNLTHLTASSEISGFCILKELTSLCSAHIFVAGFLVHHSFAKFLSGLAQITELLLVLGNVPSSALMPERLLCTFHNLKSLELDLLFCKQPHMLTLCLLKSAPNLEKLKTEICGETELEFEENGELLNDFWSDGMCANLQLVKISGISWHPNEMSFIELILSKARLLRTLWISQQEEIMMSTQEALYELLAYKRASAEAQVLIKGEGEGY